VRLLSELPIGRLRLPPITAELLPESDSRFFERLSSIPVEFSRDAQGKVTRLTVRAAGRAFCYEKFSDQAPEMLTRLSLLEGGNSRNWLISRNSIQKVCTKSARVSL
jgi:hypothetical protein